MEYISLMLVPLMIFIIILTGMLEKKDVYGLFIQGVLDGCKIIYRIFPYVLGITVAVGLLNATGTLAILIKPIGGILQNLGIPSDIIPLMLIRPISGGASTGIVMDIFKNSGPDSISGKMASVIMGGTETTLYTITILFSVCKSKKVRGTLIAGLLADAAAIITSIVLVKMGMI